MIGLTGEIIFSVVGLKYTLGYELKRRVSKKYLEGFVSLYMIPVYGLFLLFIFEPISLEISDWNFLFKFIFWGVSFVALEFVVGCLFDMVFKFYPWDFYDKSKYKIFGMAYSLWTYIPVWGFYGLLLERIVKIIYGISPYIISVI